MGNLQKIGRAQVDGALEPAEPAPRKGLWFMDTSSAAAEAITSPKSWAIASSS